MSTFNLGFLGEIALVAVAIPFRLQVLGLLYSNRTFILLNALLNDPSSFRQ